MTKEEFISYIKNPELLNNDSVFKLKELIDDFPAFQAARVLYLINLRNINSYKLEEELQKNAPYIPDRQMLFKLLNNHDKEAKEFRLLPFDRDAFNEFFNNEEKTQEFQQLKVNTASFDINELAQAENGTNGSQKNDLIDKFINENPTIRPRPATPLTSSTTVHQEKNDIDDGLITETLADIYIKQKLYNEAIKAYEKLSLKFPEKNSYFASRIKKIKELISKNS